MRLIVYSLAALLLISTSAMAQNAVSRAPLVAAITVTNVSGVAEAARNRKYLLMLNPSASATVACTFDGSTAVANAAGTVTLGPLGNFVFNSNGFVPKTVITCISSAASSPLTLIE